MLDLLRSLLAAIAAFFIGILKTLTRITAFVGKEVTEVRRRPGALASLILGPFLIMVLFGTGYGGERRRLDTVMVVPADADLPREIAFYQERAGPGLHILEVTDDLAGARARLQLEQIDLLVIAPADVEASFRSGQQSVVAVEHNQIDPIRDNYARLVARQQVAELNRAIVEQVAAEGQRYAVQTLNYQEAASVPPGVVAAPTRLETRNLAPASPSVTEYYAPAVLALVLQHMGVTLAALSIVRERLSGAIDLFRVAPVRVLEILAGKYLAYGFLNLALAAAVIYLMVGPLGVPMLGDLISVAGVVALLTFASLGLGLLISIIADSERQAVQLSMLVLLASVFLSGFVLPLDEFVPAVRWVAYGLPVTHGIRLLQDIMLRGTTYALWHFWALGGLSALLFLLNALALRRNMSQV